MSARAALHEITLVVNGDPVHVAVPAQRTLVKLLRENLGLTGTKQGCDEGDCGACTVVLDGKPAFACITLAVECDGERVDTVESLADGPRLHPLQEAFVRRGAVQCGYCTPGMLMSARALIERKKKPTREEIAVALSGNLCRCTGYARILDAVEDAANAMHASGDRDDGDAP